MKNTMQDGILQISPTVRIRDFDRNQYVVERLSIPRKSKPFWFITDYCTTKKSAASRVKSVLSGEATRAARNACMDKFDADGWENIILTQLTDKDGK
jgi:hypothetical protein